MQVKAMNSLDHLYLILSTVFSFSLTLYLLVNKYLPFKVFQLDNFF